MYLISLKRKEGLIYNTQTIYLEPIISRRRQ